MLLIRGRWVRFCRRFRFLGDSARWFVSRDSPIDYHAEDHWMILSGTTAKISPPPLRAYTREKGAVGRLGDPGEGDESQSRYQHHNPQTFCRTTRRPEG